MPDLLLLYLHIGFSLGIAYMIFCRLHKSSHNVRWEVRWSWAMVGASSAAMAMAPMLGWAAPTTVTTGFLGACFCTFAASARAWKNGVPAGLSKCQS